MNKHGGYLGDDKVIDFSVNINPLGPPKKALERMVEVLDGIRYYPEIDGGETRAFLARRLGIQAGEIILGNGATELIYLFSRSMTIGKALILQPTFSEYNRAFTLAGTEVYPYLSEEGDCFKVNIARLIDKIEEIRPSVIVICNPNNPTGTYIEPHLVQELLETVDQGTYFFIDESFVGFQVEGLPLELVREHPVFILRSMTKFYGIPGIRLGYGVGSKELIARMQRFKEPWTLNYLALELAKLLMDDKGYVYETRKWLFEEKDFLYTGLKELESLRVFPSHSNFYLCKTLDTDGEALKRELLTSGIYIRTCQDFFGLGRDFFRVAIKTRPENLRLLEGLKKALGYF
jgi:threonine-phosphate decarboxylase